VGNTVIPAGYAKVKDKCRFQFLILGPTIVPVNWAIFALWQRFKLPKETKMRIDINPTSTFF
jgi:primosomal protein N' (replication factor Y)